MLTVAIYFVLQLAHKGGGANAYVAIGLEVKDIFTLSLINDGELTEREKHT